MLHIYREPELHLKDIGPAFFLLAILIILFLTQVNLIPFNQEEAIIFQTAREFYFGRNWLKLQIFGQPFSYYPFTTWALSFLHFFYPHNLFLVRLGTIFIPLILLIVLTGTFSALSIRIRPEDDENLTFRSQFPLHIFGVSGSIWVCASAILFFFSWQNGHLLWWSFWINAGWIAIYWWGISRHQWGKAWFLAVICVLLGYLTGGTKTFLIFYLPLFLIHRPTRIWKRMIHPLHWGTWGIFLLAFFIWGWYDRESLLIGKTIFLNWNFIREEQGYFRHLCTFPFRMLLGIGPWLIFFWPAYCEAFKKLATSSTITSFFRPILNTLFWSFWLIPLSKGTDLLPLLGPVGILCANYYRILIRRYGEFLKQIWLWLTLVIPGISLIWIICIFWLPRYQIFDLHLDSNEWPALYLGILWSMACFLWFWIKRPQRIPIWGRGFLILLAWRSMYGGTWGIWQAYRYQLQQEFAHQVEHALPFHVDTLYVLLPDIQLTDYLKELILIDRKIIWVERPDHIPIKEQQVYILGDKNEPLLWERDWQPISSPILLFNKQSFILWKGVWNEKVYSWRASLPEPNYQSLQIVQRLPRWQSNHSFTFSQDQVQHQPFLISQIGRHRYPAIRFNHNQFLTAEFTDIAEHFGKEHSFFFVVTPTWDSLITFYSTILDMRLIAPPWPHFLQLRWNTVEKKFEVLFSDDKEIKTIASPTLPYQPIFVIAFQRQTDKVALWINGEKVGSMTFKVLPEFKDKVLGVLGASWNPEKGFYHFFSGYILEWYIYNRSLTDHRILTISQALLQSYKAEE